MIPVFLGSDIISETLSEDGAQHVVDRRCRLNVDAPYILKKVSIPQNNVVLVKFNISIGIITRMTLDIFPFALLDLEIKKDIITSSL